LCGFKFRRQFPLGPFFADFCCFDERLIVEVDGSQHADRTDEDENRTHYIAEQGFRVLRFWNNDVLSNTAAVCEQILKEIKKPHPLPLLPHRVFDHPLPKGEGRVRRVYEAISGPDMKVKR
jgi:very-short-patch-repair endonuclease